MRLKSILQFFNRTWQKQRPIARKRQRSPFAALLIEQLERRDLLAGIPPTLVTAGILPVDGSSTTSALPVIQVEFSDTMTNSALNPSNYVLLGSTGTVVPINSVAFVTGTSPVDSEVTLTYNNSNPLVVDTYTLYVRGNNLIDANNGLAMAQPGQLFAANSGTNTLAVVNVSGNGSLGAAANYNIAATSPTTASPNAVAFADLNGDGLPDLVVVNEGLNQVNIYAGQAAAAGGGFSSTPTLTLTLPAATPTASTAESIAIADFNKDGEPDLAIASGNSDNVTVFLNTSSTVGVMSFGGGTSYTVDADPVGITAADFDGDGNIDLAVACSTAPTTIFPFAANTYRVDILPGLGDGTFGSVVRVGVGDTAPLGVTTPTSIAEGVFTTGALPTFVVGGATGAEVLTNVSTVGNFKFNTTPLLSASSIVSLAVGTLSSGGSLSIAAATTLNTVEVYQSNGAGGFQTAASFGVPGGTLGKLAIGDLNGDGLGDIVVTNAKPTGGVSVLVNSSVGGTISAVTNTSPIVVNSFNNRLQTGEQVVINGVLGDLAANGTFTITVLNGGISNISGAGAAPIVVTTSVSHMLTTGDIVTITGSTFTSADGTFVITVTSPTTFTLNGTTAAGSDATGAATWVSSNEFSLNGTTGSGAYLGGGTWALTGVISNASESGANPIVITSVGNNLATGERVAIASSTLPSANGNFTITILNSTIALASITAAGVVTINAASTYGLAVGDTITIAGNDLAGADGTWTIVAIAGNSFTFDNPAAVAIGQNAAGGTWTCADKFTLNGTAGPAGAAPGGTWTTLTGFVLSNSGNVYSVDSDPVAVALADTNQDGALDIVTANFTANDFTTLLGNGDGTFQTPTVINLNPVQGTMQNVIVADLNDDGIDDIIVANNNNNAGSTDVTIFEGLGNGQYGPAITISPGNGIRSITGLAIGHFSNAATSSAAFPDIAFADAQDGKVGFLQNKLTVSGAPISATSFASITPINVGGTTLTDIVAADFNDDGLTDLLVSYAGGGHHASPGVAALINTSVAGNDFQFNATQYDNTAAGPISSLAVGDFDGDGNLDFVAAVNNAPGQIILNTGDGAGDFNAGSTFFTTVDNPVSIAAADFDNDGFPDIVVASSSTSATDGGVAVLLNEFGTGFGTPLQTNFLPGTALASVVSSDVNGDGVPDIVVSTATLWMTNISGASNASPIVISTGGFGGTNGLAAGDTVTITGVLGNTAANGTWTIANVTFNSFQLVGSTGSGAYTSGGSWALGDTNDNVYVMMGEGNGLFAPPIPYFAGATTAAPFQEPTYLAITPSSIERVTTFTTGGNLINTQLVNNGNFESTDLSGETGNLLGWRTYDLDALPGSNGAWGPQSGTISPLSGTTVPQPDGTYAAMLDEPNQVPYQATGNNNNTLASYAGSHALYQDVTIPANATVANFSLSLYIDNTGQGVTGAGNYSDPTVTSSLDFRTPDLDQQVRVDIMNPATSGAISGASDTSPIIITSANNGLVTGTQVEIAGILGNTAANGTWTITRIDANHFSLVGSTGTGVYTSGGTWTAHFNPLSVDATPNSGDVLENLFQTDPTTSFIDTTKVTADLLAFAGKTIEIRIAAANNDGPLIVGVDDVALNVQFNDNSTPPGTSKPITLSNVGVSNPSFTSGTPPIAYTNDPTIVGTIHAPYGLNSIAYIAIDPTNSGFTSSSVVKTAEWDAQGNFSYTMTNVPAGLNTIGVEVVDRAGNTVATTLTFFMQTDSVSQWEPIGPQGIDVTNQPVNYTKVSGRITVTVPDLNDPSGNSYLVGTANGGIWKTVDGGSDWLSVTNNLTDAAGNPIAVSIGGMAQSASNPKILYAATGVGDQQLDSEPGVGVLKSTNDGLTWTLIGNSETVLAAARATALAVDPNNPNNVYVAVASGGEFGSGVYKSTDGGLTWNIITTPANMFTSVGPNWSPGNGPSLTAAGVPSLASVTSMVIDPFNSSRIIIGLGNIGNPNGNITLAASASAGVWYTFNSGGSWLEVLGDNNTGIPNNYLPGGLTNPGGAGNIGTTVGRVTVAIGTGAVADERYLYVMMSTPPGNNVAPNVNWGSFKGLYKSSDNMLDWTKVMLMQDDPPPVAPPAHDFVNINPLGEDGANAGTLIVDPSDPNVVYLGGSSFWDNGSPNDHALLYIDTGDMLDTVTPDANGVIVNNGDDAAKYNKGAIANGGFYDPSPGAADDPYHGEGVYWYDMIEGQSGGDGNLDLLPGEITSLAIDAEGRLLVGTDGGIWRGVNNGFGYDFTSGNTGILNMGHGHGPTTMFTPAGMSFTSINGNLQISDMTSVAIDPFNRGVYYTTQVDTGVAGSTGPLEWVSQGLTGPTVNGVNLGIPTAGAVLTADPPAGSPAGTPVTLYRIWQFANQLALEPEFSTNNGTSWTSIGGAGISVTATAGVIPGFAVNTQPLSSSGISLNELLFGSDTIYHTGSSSIVWDPISPQPLSSTGGLPTAMAIAPTGVGVYLVGDNRGDVYYTGDLGGDNWPQETTGLPTPGSNPVNGITFDPNNDNIAFAMYGGTGIGVHVYTTINASKGALATWTPVVGPWGSAETYSMVIDHTPALGAPTGKF